MGTTKKILGKICQEWKEALSQLPVCGKDDGKLSRRLGGFWLRLGKRAPCIGAGWEWLGKVCKLQLAVVFQQFGNRRSDFSSDITYYD